MVVGVTGGVGSGKSLFSSTLGRLGAYVIDADDIGRRIADENEDVRKAIRDAFGEDVFDSEGKLKRRELGRIVFGDSAKLQILNRIIWPVLIEEVKARIAAVKSDKEEDACIVVDMAVLFEAGLESLFDMVVAIVSPLEKRIRWLAESRGWSRQETLDRVQSQMDLKEKIKKADVVIENDGNPYDLMGEAEAFFLKIQSG